MVAVEPFVCTAKELKRLSFCRRPPVCGHFGGLLPATVPVLRSELSK